MRRPWQRPSTAVSWAFTGPMPLSPSLCLRKAPLRAEPHAILTPHIAWTTREALQNLMDITTRNLRTWLEGNGEHIVNR